MIASRRALGVIACCTLSASCSTSGTYWHCSAPAGSYDTHDVDVPETATEFSGEMIFNSVDASTRWHPVARLGFTDKALPASDCHCNGLEAMFDANDPKFILVSLVVDGQRQPYGRVPYDKPVTFKVRYAPNGDIRMDVGISYATGSSFTPKRNRLHYSCSSADVTFRNITVS